MKKLLLFFVLFFALFLAISYPTKASSLKVKTKSKITVKAGDYKKQKLSIFYNGIDVTDYCEDVYVKGVNFNAVLVLESSHGYWVDTDYLKKKKTKIKLIVKFSPYFYDVYSDAEEVSDGDYYYSRLGKFSYYNYFKTIKITKTITIRKKYRKKLNIDGLAYKYNTKSNKFKVCIRNNSHKTVTILSSAKAIDRKYKKYNRSLTTGGRAIKIKPGKEKKFYFNVIGSRTWPDYRDFDVKIKIKYKGKIYTRKI